PRLAITSLPSSTAPPPAARYTLSLHDALPIYVAALDEHLRRNETVIRGEVRVREVGAGPADVGRGDLEMVFLSAGIAAFLRAVRPHERRPAEAPIDGGVVHHDRVLHVVPMVRHER